MPFYTYSVLLVAEGTEWPPRTGQYRPRNEETTSKLSPYEERKKRICSVELRENLDGRHRRLICQFLKPLVCDIDQRKGGLLSLILISSKLVLFVISTVSVTSVH